MRGKIVEMLAFIKEVLCIRIKFPMILKNL